jgi:hypothetical protein
MLRSIKTLQDYKVLASDGDLGALEEFYFDSKDWTVRYLVINTGQWLAGRKLLISTPTVDQLNEETQTVLLALPRAVVENSPNIDLDQPISRDHETDLHHYYKWPFYWPEDEATEEQVFIEQTDDDRRLRRTGEVIGYDIRARDGDIGHVEDFVVDDQTWMINYMIVNTGNWLPGRNVVVSPSYVETVDWSDSRVYMELLRETIEKSPEYDQQFLQ